MATTSTPITPAVKPATSVLPVWLTNWISFVKAHETLLIIVLSAFLLFRTGQGIENAFVNHYDKKATAAATIVNTDASSNQNLTNQLSALQAATDKKAAQLKADIDNATAALKVQQAKDALANQQAILDRWNTLLPMKPGAVKQIGTTDVITPEAANSTVQALEQIPVLQSQITDLNAKLLLDDQVIGKQSELITGLNTQIVDEKKSHIDDVNLAKAKGRKSWFSGFKIGVIVGAIGVEAIRVAIGKP